MCVGSYRESTDCDAGSCGRMKLQQDSLLTLLVVATEWVAWVAWTTCASDLYTGSSCPKTSRTRVCKTGRELEPSSACGTPDTEEETCPTCGKFEDLMCQQ